MWFRFALVFLISPLVFAEAQLDAAQLDAKTGLIKDRGWQVVSANCVSCHSARLVTQNRMSRQGWLDTIRYMQKNHNLWALGEFEPVILDYLAEHYSQRDSTPVRRRNLPYF